MNAKRALVKIRDEEVFFEVWERLRKTHPVAQIKGPMIQQTEKVVLRKWDALNPSRPRPKSS